MLKHRTAPHITLCCTECVSLVTVFLMFFSYQYLLQLCVALAEQFEAIIHRRCKLDAQGAQTELMQTQ